MTCFGRTDCCANQCTAKSASRRTGNRNMAKPVGRLYIMGRLCDVFGVWCSGDEPYSGYWLEIDAVKDVETCEWCDDVTAELQPTDNGDIPDLATAVENELSQQDNQEDALRWPDFDYMRDVNPYRQEATGEWP